MARCDGCTFYDPSIINGVADKTQGACRRSPPMMMAVAGGFQTSFPIVRNDMWCGEHRWADVDKAMADINCAFSKVIHSDYAGRQDYGEQ